MAMGKAGDRQSGMWIETASLSRGPGHPFYAKLNEVFCEQGFDDFVEGLCKPFYADGVGRPSLAPAVYFRLLLVGYFEGIDSERGIAWRVADSMSLREFLGFALDRKTPDHSTISRNRRLLSLEVHQEVFGWVLALLARKDLLRGKTLGVDATTLEANAAMRSIVRRDTGSTYLDYLRELARESGIETPSRDDLARLDKKRRKKSSNDDWTNPHDPSARITKMKDGRTHLAHKVEHAVDLDTGAVIGVTIQPADRGDTQSLEVTLDETLHCLAAILDDERASEAIDENLLRELVADRGYHSGAALLAQETKGLRTYIAEPNRGRRRWREKRAEQAATYANRRRIRGERGRMLHKLRCEKVERSMAHCYETGGMRRIHLREHENILKRLVVHIGGHNLGLLMRRLIGKGTPRGLQGWLRAALDAIRRWLGALERDQSPAVLEWSPNPPFAAAIAR